MTYFNGKELTSFWTDHPYDVHFQEIDVFRS